MAPKGTTCLSVHSWLANWLGLGFCRQSQCSLRRILRNQSCSTRLGKATHLYLLDSTSASLLELQCTCAVTALLLLWSVPAWLKCHPRPCESSCTFVLPSINMQGASLIFTIFCSYLTFKKVCSRMSAGTWRGEPSNLKSPCQYLFSATGRNDSEECITFDGTYPFLHNLVCFCDKITCNL
ncbi:uncharacterized protein LOC116660797 isoform X1 [Camelus ferus]|uniref:Uncharacterized protein LOC116660797 isoform X1 n=1 Tax=Camelus ferus TaxID=419612 RepID=A0A8B8SAV6_CAMFR|nr:uncharacterized protein LOC116660797 isoform X1 [Camelus ferus]